MNTNRHKLLHYVLIILLIFAPMGSVFAIDNSHCDMDDMSAMSSNDTVQQIMQHSNDNHSNDSMGQPEQMNHQCCCCDDGCVSNCDMGTTASLLMQVSSYSPVFVITENFINYSPELQLRELTPPSRPPLNIS